MPDPLGFLLEMLSSRPNPHAPAPALPVLAVALAAPRHGVDLPAWDESACDELEEDTARDALTTLRTQLSDALLGEDASAGRELLNQALDDWQARVSVEEELADHELPGVEVTASALPHVPLPPWYERDPTLPRDTAARCPTLGPFLLAVVGVLLTEATNIHLSGYADRVRPCEAPDCRTPFLDAGDGRRRRFCSPRCRARQSARARARVR